ncbi:hypothetical protein DSO57_1025452 [Entomophthora muscae]|uniref:Uncharacterized protein n=1 Tax=Entomophthora muscae TaxID=34485 RepID=A0ACC2UBT5_9FUNG|nr:hypothetical protein DSO57_1025452 [Entomophthora muscae]
MLLDLSGFKWLGNWIAGHNPACLEPCWRIEPAVLTVREDPSHLLLFLGDLADCAHGLVATGGKLVKSVIIDDLELLSPSSELAVSPEGFLAKVSSPLEPKFSTTKAKLSPCSCSQAHHLAAWQPGSDEPGLLHSPVIPYILPLEAPTSSHSSVTLGGILVDLFPRMGARLSYFSSPLLHPWQWVVPDNKVFPQFGTFILFLWLIWEHLRLTSLGFIKFIMLDINMLHKVVDILDKLPIIETGMKIGLQQLTTAPLHLLFLSAYSPFMKIIDEVFGWLRQVIKQGTLTGPNDLFDLPQVETHALPEETMDKLCSHSDLFIPVLQPRFHPCLSTHLTIHRGRLMSHLVTCLMACINLMAMSNGGHYLLIRSTTYLTWQLW